MKKKLKLNELTVNSFVTEQVKGGAAIPPPTQMCTPTYQVGCLSVHSCPTIPADQCATFGGGCPTVNGGCPTVNIACATVHNPCGSNPVVACLDTLKCEIIAINM